MSPSISASRITLGPACAGGARPPAAIRDAASATARSAASAAAGECRATATEAAPGEWPLMSASCAATSPGADWRVFRSRPGHLPPDAMLGGPAAGSASAGRPTRFGAAGGLGGIELGGRLRRVPGSTAALSAAAGVAVSRSDGDRRCGTSLGLRLVLGSAAGAAAGCGSPLLRSRRRRSRRRVPARSGLRPGRLPPLRAACSPASAVSSSRSAPLTNGTPSSASASGIVACSWNPASGASWSGAAPGFAFGFAAVPAAASRATVRLLHRGSGQRLSGKRRQAGGFEPVSGRPRIERDRLGLGRDRGLPGGDDLDPLGCRDLVGRRGLGIRGCDVLAVLVACSSRCSSRRGRIRPPRRPRRRRRRSASLSPSRAASPCSSCPALFRLRALRLFVLRPSSAPPGSALARVARFVARRRRRRRRRRPRSSSAGGRCSASPVSSAAPASRRSPPARPRPPRSPRPRRRSPARWAPGSAAPGALRRSRRAAAARGGRPAGPAKSSRATMTRSV